MSSPKPQLQSHGTMDPNSSTASMELKKSPPGTPTPERPPSTGSAGSPISDDTCPICLGHITDKCVADSCLHSFCLVCLKEWAKQKAVCPLCKLTFTKIMYDIKSASDYKEWRVPRPDPAAERSQGIVNFQEFLDAERRRFFGYRTTHFPGAASLRRLHPVRHHAIPSAIPSGPREPRSSRYNLRGSSMFRLSVYLNNVWVQPLADITGRYRQSSPELYREQPALTHRLVPWVNRELAALLPSSRIGVVLGDVMELIERHAIDSREFRRAMQPHLGRRTNHFIHEFYHFARSPYDMIGHDNAAQYVPRYGFNDDESSNSSNSDDSDAVVEVDSQGNPITLASGREASQAQVAPGNVVREETLTHEGSVVISSSSSDSSSDSDEPRTHSSPSQGNFSETHNPEPPGNVMSRLIGRARNFLNANAVNDGASTSRSDETSGNVRADESSVVLKSEVPSNIDSDDCLIVEEVSKIAKTPEIISIVSDNEEPSVSSTASDSHWKKKITKTYDDDAVVPGPSHKQDSQPKKPKLKRSNFHVPANQPSCSGSSDGHSAKRDHSYCTENGSASVSRPVSQFQPIYSSSESACENHEDSQKSKGDLCDDGKYENVSDSSFLSLSESASSYHSPKILRNKSKDKSQKNYSTKHTEKSRDSVYEQSSSHKSRSSGRGKSSSNRRAKKDHKSKIKSSSSRSNSKHHTREDVDRYNPNVNSSTSMDTMWDNSDREWLPASRRTHRSRLDHEDESSLSRDSSVDHKNSSYREWKSDKHNAKTKSSRKKKKRSKDKHRSEKRKAKKGKHKKKSKKHQIYSSSDTDDESPPKKKVKVKRKALCIESSISEDSDYVQRYRSSKKPRRSRKIESTCSDSSWNY